MNVLKVTFKHTMYSAQTVANDSIDFEK